MRCRMKLMLWPNRLYRGSVLGDEGRVVLGVKHNLRNGSCGCAQSDEEANEADKLQHTPLGTEPWHTCSSSSNRLLIQFSGEVQSCQVIFSQSGRHQLTFLVRKICAAPNSTCCTRQRDART